MDDRKELLEKCEVLKDAVDRINEKVPVLKEMQDGIKEMQEQIRSNIEAQVSAVDSNSKSAAKSKELAEKAANYVKSQKEKIEQCLELLNSVLDRVDGLEKRIDQLSDDIEDKLTTINDTKSVSTGLEHSDEEVINVLERLKESNELSDIDDAFLELESQDGRIKLIIDGDTNKLQLHFSNASVSNPYRDEMRANGFRWYRPEQCWSVALNEDSYEFGRELIARYDAKK